MTIPTELALARSKAPAPSVENVGPWVPLELEVHDQDDKAYVAEFFQQVVAIESWVNRYEGNTLKLYRREVTRFLLFLYAYDALPLRRMPAATIYAYAHYIVQPQLTPELVRALPSQTCSRYFQSALSQESAQRSLTVLNSLYNWLRDAGHVAINPLAEQLRIKKVAPKKAGITRFFNLVEMSVILQLLDVAGDEVVTSGHDRLVYETRRWLIHLVFSTGFRREEVVSTRLCDISMSALSDGTREWVVKVIGKGGKERRVPMSLDIQAAFIRYRKALGRPVDPTAAPRDPIIMSTVREAGATDLPVRCLNPSTVYKHLRAIVTTLAVLTTDEALRRKLSECSPHWLRHSFGTGLVRTGADLKEIQDLLGHESLTTTGIYLHTEDDGRRAAVNRLTKAAREGPTENPGPGN